MTLSRGAFSTDAFSTDAFEFGAESDGTSITNANASTDAGNRYNICMRTGFRVLPHSLVKDAYGDLVRPESFDMRHPQEFVRPRAEKQDGPQNPEPSNTFISTSIAPEDL